MVHTHLTSLLRPRTAVVPLAVVAILVLACGTLPAAIGGGTPRPGPDSERMAVLEEVGAQIEAAQGQAGSPDMQAVLRAFRNNPAFEASGAAPDGSIWARFTGGPMVVVPPDLPSPQTRRGAAGLASPPEALEHGPSVTELPVPRSHRLPAPAGQMGLPSSDVAVMMDALGGDFGQYGTVIGAWLKANGYDARIVEPTVDNLKAVKDVGVFYFGTHGGLACTGTAASCLESYRTRRAGAELDEPFTEWSYSLWTATRVTPANDAAYAEDLRAGQLGYMYARFVPNGKPEWHYAITINFIRTYMAFSANSLVFLDACGSFDEDLKFGFADAGASVFAGWTKPIDPGERSRYFFDRLLGINAIKPEGVPQPEPPNRPFDYEAVLRAMEEYKLDFWRSSHVVLDEGDGGDFQEVTEDYVSYLRAERMNGGFSILLPSIRWLLVNEAQQSLTVEGEFGAQTGEVEIDGQTVEVLEWGEQKIRVRLPPAGEAGGSGEVVVRVRDHESNAVPLTAWHGEWTYTEGPYLPEIWYYLHFDLYLRADVHPYRLIPDEEPYPADLVDLEAAAGSTATWECSASGEIAGVAISGSGEGDLPLNRAEGVGFHATATLDPETRVIEDMAFRVLTDPETICFSTATGYGVKIEQTVDFTFLPVLEQPLQPIRLDEDLILQGDTRSLVPGTSDWPTLAWPDIEPRSPPDGVDTEARHTETRERPG